MLDCKTDVFDPSQNLCLGLCVSPVRRGLLVLVIHVVDIFPVVHFIPSSRCFLSGFSGFFPLPFLPCLPLLLSLPQHWLDNFCLQQCTSFKLFKTPESTSMGVLATAAWARKMFFCPSRKLGQFVKRLLFKIYPDANEICDLVGALPVIDDALRRLQPILRVSEERTSVPRVDLRFAPEAHLPPSLEPLAAACIHALSSAFPVVVTTRTEHIGCDADESPTPTRRSAAPLLVSPLLHQRTEEKFVELPSLATTVTRRATHENSQTLNLKSLPLAADAPEKATATQDLTQQRRTNPG